MLTRWHTQAPHCNCRWLSFVLPFLRLCQKRAGCVEECMLVCVSVCVSEALTFYAVCLLLPAAAKGYYNFVVPFARHKTRRKPERKAKASRNQRLPGLQSRQSKRGGECGGLWRGASTFNCSHNNMKYSHSLAMRAKEFSTTAGGRIRVG